MTIYSAIVKPGSLYIVVARFLLINDGVIGSFLLGCGLKAKVKLWKDALNVKKYYSGKRTVL